jgi:hypothetical protein
VYGTVTTYIPKKWLQSVVWLVAEAHSLWLIHCLKSASRILTTAKADEQAHLVSADIFEPRIKNILKFGKVTIQQPWGTTRVCELSNVLHAQRY